MKYRIKNIRREGWVQTDDQLFRPADDVTPIVLPEEVPEEGPEEEGTQIYIIPDNPEAEQPDATTLFTPPPRPDVPPATKGEGKEAHGLVPFLKTKEGKIMIGVIGGFVLLLTVLITVLLCLGIGDSDTDETDGSNSTANGHKHTYETVIVKEASCTESGTVKEVCSDCGYTESEKTVTSLGHKWKTDKEKSEEATCEEEGKLIKECERCKETDTETQQAKGHTWIETDSEEATCTEEGQTKYRCASCSEKKTETEPKKEHDLSDPVRTEPTCASEGKEVATCKDCGKEDIKLLKKLEHETVPATCTEGKTCKNCNEQLSEPLGHKYENGICTVCKMAEPNANGNDVPAGTGIELTSGSVLTIGNAYTLTGDRLELSLTLTVSNNYYSNQIYNEYITAFCPGSSQEKAIEADSNMLVDPTGTEITKSFRIPYTGNGKYIINIYDGSINHTCSITVTE